MSGGEGEELDLQLGSEDLQHGYLVQQPEKTPQTAERSLQNILDWSHMSV